MLKELVQFTDALDEELKAIGVIPKEGLHIFLHHETDDNNELSISKTFRYEVYSKKQQELSTLLKKAASLAQIGWMVNTNKCFDLPAKGIHSCSPYCLAFKRESIRGGGKFNDAKAKLYERVNSYFAKAIDLLDDPAEKERVKIFRDALNSETKMHFYLDQIPEYKSLKDAEYIVFYLDLPVERYQIPSEKYLGGKLFNTEEYNKEGADGLVYGTNNFLNGFNSKKPYLMHQSATFDITSRISAKEAKSLFEFENIAGRRIFPNPLPIFVYADEREASISLFKRDALEGGAKRGYREIIEELQARLKKELGNYYLLFYRMGEVKDFDFVSKFEYNLKDSEGKDWHVDDLFKSNRTYTLSNVFEFERTILPIILNNALIVKTKTDGLMFRYFDDIDASYCKTANTFLLAMKYRMALYDFIYKSNRTAFTQKSFEDILLTSLLDDIRLDKYEGRKHSEDLNIRQKLNILFSLYHNFQPFKKVYSFMPTKIIELRESLEALASGEADITSDEQFAFVAGQVIYYILSKSKSADKSYSRLEPFLQLTDAERLKQSILKVFNTYKHERFSKRFSNSFAQVLAYSTSRNTNLKDLMPLMLAGFFSENQLFGKGAEEENIQNEETINA
jgi:CRISPR-associated protein Csh1